MDTDVAPLSMWAREVCLHILFWAHCLHSRIIAGGRKLFASGSDASRALAHLRTLSLDMRQLKGALGSVALVW